MVCECDSIILIGLADDRLFVIRCDVYVGRGTKLPHGDFLVTEMERIYLEEYVLYFWHYVVMFIYL